MQCRRLPRRSSRPLSRGPSQLRTTIRLCYFHDKHCSRRDVSPFDLTLTYTHPSNTLTLLTSSRTFTSVISTVTTIAFDATTIYTSYPQPSIAPRQELATPPTKPSYATYCASDVAYASACSCMGFTARVVTKTYSAGQLEIATVTSTATITIEQPSPTEIKEGDVVTVTVTTKCG